MGGLEKHPSSPKAAETKAEFYDWLPLSKDSPDLKWLNVSCLEVDHRYQRQTVSELIVLRIAHSFDWAKFGTLSVVKRGGKYFVIDGQHRLLACLRRGIIRVPCIVTESAGVEHEAENFIGINTNTAKVTVYDKYKAKLAAGDSIHRRIDEMLRLRGLEVSPDVSPLHIAFPALLVKTFHANAYHCTGAIDLQRKAIGPGTALHHQVHKGLFYIACRQKDGNVYDHGERLLMAGGLPTMLSAIRGQAAESEKKAVTDRVAAIGILAVLNKGLRSTKVHL